MTEEKAIQLLRKHNLKVTSNRVTIMQCLDDHLHFHAISDIEDHTKLNIKSIYNNIKTLIEVGLVDSHSFGGVVKYAIHDNLDKVERPEIHIVNGHQIDHINVPYKIFEDITKEVTQSGYKMKSIKIFVDVS